MNNPDSGSQEHSLPWQTNATRFWWVRHAPVSHLKHMMYGTMDVEADVSDAAKFNSLALRLPADAVWYTSHLKRTHQTADAVERAGLGAKQVLQSELIGEMDFGDDTGKTHKELLLERDDPYVGFWPVSPVSEESSGETMKALCARVHDFVEHCVDKHPKEDIVCFSHMGPILAALTNALSLHLHHSVCFSIDNLSITQINHYADLHHAAPEYRVLRVSEQFHD